MQTTLRINDEIYRKAKTRAAEEGVTLTHFIEEALRFRLQHTSVVEAPWSLPAFSAGPTVPKDFDLIEALRQADSQRDENAIADLRGER